MTAVHIETCWKNKCASTFSETFTNFFISMKKKVDFMSLKTIKIDQIKFFSAFVITKDSENLIEDENHAEKRFPQSKICTFFDRSLVFLPSHVFQFLIYYIWQTVPKKT